MIDHPYKATILVASEHRDGKLTPDNVRSFIEQTFGGMGWDHPPETELVELAAPGTWSMVEPGADVAGGPLFVFHEDRARAALERSATEDPDYFGPEPIGINDDADELHHCLDKATWSARDIGVGDDSGQESAIITCLRPGFGLGIYPMSLDDPVPILAVNIGDGSPTALSGSDDLSMIEPPEDRLEYTIAWLRQAVRVANGLAGRVEGRAPEQAVVLNHTYSGTAIRLSGCEHVTDLGHGERETIGGAFRVLCWLPTGGAIVGNGEQPEGIWATDEKPERVA